MANDRFFVARHADERCEERGITAWQMIAGLEEACGVREMKERRKKCKRWVHRGRYAVEVEVEVIYPSGDPSGRKAERRRKSLREPHTRGRESF